MTDHALVVGCDAYPSLPNGDLTSAVADALAMRDWFAARDHPTVTTLLASPGPGGVPLGDVEADGQASRANFAAAVMALIGRTNVGVDDRLFVYFAGHGCATDPHNPVLARDALAFTDYVAHDPAASCVGVEDLLVRLEQSRFGTVVVWLDACRDHPFGTAFQLSGLGVDPLASSRMPPALFLGQATQRGGYAHARPRVGGDFTRALLNGLRGDGAAKVYDETDDPPYVVRWSSLQRYLDARLPDQRPRLRGEGDIVLSKHPDGAFRDVTLSVDVAPAAAGRTPGLHGSVHYADATSFADGFRPFDGPTPVHLPVPPRRHQVRVLAGERWAKKSVDVYQNESVTLPLLDLPLVPEADGPPYRGSGQVVVTADDPAAAIEVRDLRSEVRLAGTALVRGDLPSGFYHAVLVDPNGHDIAEPVDVERNYPGRVSLTAPLGPLPDMAEGRLRWAGGAAIAAVEGMLRAHTHTPDEPLIAVLDLTGNLGPVRPLGASTSPRGPWRVGTGLMTVVHVSPREPRTRLVIAGHVLSMPVVPNTVAGWFLAPTGLEVALFDRSARAQHTDVLLLDHVQRLLMVGRRTAATQVLERFTGQRTKEPLAWTAERSVVARMLTTRLFNMQQVATFPVSDTTIGHRIDGGGLWDVRDETGMRRFHYD